MTTIKKLDEDLPLKIEWLHSFLGVATEGGFTKAARVLHLSQPAVSTHVRELETNLGTKLFEHVGGTVRLTRAGEAVAREARRILEDVRELRRTVSDSEGNVEGRIRVGASTTPGNYLLPALLGAFERKHPRVRADLRIGNTGRILDLLRVNEVDLGVVGLQPDASEFVSRPFAEDRIVLFASPDHSLARRPKLRLTDLARERLCLREEESATRALVEGYFARRRVSPEVLELASPETVKRAVAAGLGIGALSEVALEWELRLGRLAVLPVSDFELRRRLHVIHHRRKHLGRALGALLEALQAGGNAASR